MIAYWIGIGFGVAVLCWIGSGWNSLMDEVEKDDALMRGVEAEARSLRAAGHDIDSGFYVRRFNELKALR